jgi:hypothetical protein
MEDYRGKAEATIDSYLIASGWSMEKVFSLILWHKEVAGKIIYCDEATAIKLAEDGA